MMLQSFCVCPELVDVRRFSSRFLSRIDEMPRNQSGAIRLHLETMIWTKRASLTVLVRGGLTKALRGCGWVAAGACCCCCCGGGGGGARLASVEDCPDWAKLTVESRHWYLRKDGSAGWEAERPGETEPSAKQYSFFCEATPSALRKSDLLLTAVEGISMGMQELISGI